MFNMCIRLVLGNNNCSFIFSSSLPQFFLCFIIFWTQFLLFLSLRMKTNGLTLNVLKSVVHSTQSVTLARSKQCTISIKNFLSSRVSKIISSLDEESLKFNELHEFLSLSMRENASEAFKWKPQINAWEQTTHHLIQAFQVIGYNLRLRAVHHHRSVVILFFFGIGVEFILGSDRCRLCDIGLCAECDTIRLIISSNFPINLPLHLYKHRRQHAFWFWRMEKKRKRDSN